MKRQRRQSGYLTVSVLAILLTVSSILLSILPTMLRIRREGRYDNARLQAEMLARAGALRALEQWKAESRYAGEEWRVPLGVHSSEQGMVLIQLTDERPGEKSLRVVARLIPDLNAGNPSAIDHAVQHELKLTIDITSSETKRGEN